MADSSFWDSATDFSGEEAANLAVNFRATGTKVDRTAVRALYERMQRSYKARKRWHQKTDEEFARGDEFGSVPPDHILESTEMSWVHTTDESEDDQGFLLWLGNQSQSAFETQRFSRHELARWFVATGIKSRYPFETGQAATTFGMEKALSKVERNSLLKMVIAMAIRGYGYVPTDKKSTVTGEIDKDVSALGMTIDDGTVLKYLKEAVETVLSGKAHQS